MIARRRTWIYRTHDSNLARPITFTRAVTRKEAEALILKHYKKIVVELWSSK